MYHQDVLGKGRHDLALMLKCAHAYFYITHKMAATRISVKLLPLFDDNVQMSVCYSAALVIYFVTGLHVTLHALRKSPKLKNQSSFFYFSA